jgi:hypothetical protein
MRRLPQGRAGTQQKENRFKGSSLPITRLGTYIETRVNNSFQKGGRDRGR